MNILKKFTIQNLKLNKKRTIVTIIGIMLSTALICAVSGLVTSTQKTMVNTVIENYGNYHVTFENVPKQQLKYIENNIKIESFFRSNTLGYAKLEGSKNDNKPYVYVMAFDEIALKNNGLELVSGRMPQNSDEIVISNHITTNGRVNLKVGDEITLDIGTRQTLDGYELNQNNPYNNYSEEDSIILSDNESDNKIEEQIVNTKTKTYKIVGIIERPNYLLEQYSSPGYTVITYMKDIDNVENVNVSVVFKDPKENKDITKEIINTIKNDTGKEITTQKNESLLRYQGAVSENTTNVLYGIATVIIIIIVLSSVFVIRNSFSISVSEKTRQYGMLTSIGATKKQIKSTVLLEGLIIGLIAIPLGILCGIIAIIVLLAIVNYLAGDMLFGTIFVYSVPIYPILISIFVSFITIYLSCIIPAKKASRISPIEAIRGNADIKLKAKKVKTSKLTQKLFGIGGVIASKNLKRNKKKYRTTVISLVVSIAIFVSLSSFLSYGKKMTGNYYTDIDYNISIYSCEDEKLYEQIIKLDNIQDYSYSYYLKESPKIDLEKYGTEYYKNKIKDEYEMEQQYKNQDNYIYINVVILNNEYFKKLIKELGIKEDYKEVAILEDDVLNYNEDGSMAVKRLFNVKEGNTITLNMNEQNTDIKITKITDKRPSGYENHYSSNGYIFISKDYKYIDKENIRLGSLQINSTDPDKLENEINDIKKENPEYSNIQITNYEQYKRQEDRMILLISIFLYGFIAVITLIGVTNIFNTITTNMLLRSKEFANLKSIGMTTKEFNKMINLESILYGFKALIIGIPIGLIGSYYIYKSFANSIDFGYLIPWQAILISVVFVFIIVGATMKYSLSKINKQNIIETIRQDNI